jgi:NADH-quinone oxidoreductase subunit H
VGELHRFRGGCRVIGAAAAMDWIDWTIMVTKVLFILVLLVHVAPVMAWVERRGSALMQNRVGPNRIGPLGLLQSAADGIKFIFKEDRIPNHVEKFYWFIAPLISMVPAFMAFAVIPFGSSIDIDGRHIVFQVADLNVGLLYVFSVASLGVYGIIMASWASNNKYSLLGGLRSTSQMISYELSMGLSVIGAIMIFQTVSLQEIAHLQGQTWFTLGPLSIPKWGIFVQPVGFLIFCTAAFAETNRLPFDLPEGESEIVAGYHLEYGSMKFALFMMAEYVAMLTASALMTTIYFGGWQMLPGMHLVHTALGLSGTAHEIVRVILEISSFALKVGFFMWFFVWVRWTLPRFRYDQLMDLGWKVMLPLSLVNIFVTGILIYYKVV